MERCVHEQDDLILPMGEYHPKGIYRFKRNLMRIPTAFSEEIEGQFSNSYGIIRGPKHTLEIEQS